jgi:murein L,D-transpeptidase YafK
MTRSVRQQVSAVYAVLLAPVLMCACSGMANAEAVAQAAASNLIPSYLLEVPDSVSSVLIADTASATLYRFGIAANHVVSRDQRYMSIGQNGAGKERAWDRKTPLGVYFITQQLDTSRLGAKYGDAAYALDYPNAWDRYRQRTGYGIWLHGVDPHLPRRPPRDTDGCLSLPNDDLLALAEFLQPLQTPLIVARELHWREPKDLEQARMEFRIVLDLWRRSLEQQDLVSYLSLYDDEFRYHGMDKKEWSAYRLGVFSTRNLKSVEISDLLLLADPEEPDLYISRFTQVLTGAGESITTTKRLYWKRRRDAQWQIVSEDNG